MTKPPYDDEDRDLTSHQLDDKYNPDGDGEHPGYTRADWRGAVANTSTLQGYWDWVAWQIELDEVYDEQGDSAP